MATARALIMEWRQLGGATQPRDGERIKPVLILGWSAGCDLPDAARAGLAFPASLMAPS